jgi:hypothetical protein
MVSYSKRLRPFGIWRYRMNKINVIEICQQLRRAAQINDKKLRVHSVFASSVNITGEDLFFSIVSDRHSLYPMSCRIVCNIPLTEFGLRAGMYVIVTEDTICIPQAELLIQLHNSTEIDLSIHRLEVLVHDRDISNKIDILEELVREKGTENDLSTLVTGEYRNPYADAVIRYLPEFNQAVMAGDDLAAELAGCLAGGGIGLTPSSDDLLIGYMAVYLANSKAWGQNQLEEALKLTKAMAKKAAEHTNVISGAFLEQCGRGLLSEDMIQLLAALYKASGVETIRLCGQRIQRFGSTSGTDMLTGMVLALRNLNHELQHSTSNGGDYFDKA